MSPLLEPPFYRFNLYHVYNMNPKYKAIQPRPAESSAPASEINIRVEESESRKRRRLQNHIACDRCRTKKIGCNGAKPSCSPCLRDTAECVYRQYRNLQRQEEEGQILERLNASEQLRQSQSEFMNHLHTLPIEQATEMLRRFRENPDLHAALSSPANSKLTVQPSSIRTARAMAPPTGSTTEFELAGQFRVAYPWISPVDLQELRGLLGQNTDNHAVSNSRNTSRPLPTVPETSGKPQSLEIPRSKYCDSRLENLQISYWTKIAVSNEVAATLISFYIENDHKFLGFFDADLFLDDLVACRQRFCSPFLVSSVLCVACQGYAAVKPGTNDVRIAAFQEAEMLWQGERSDPSLISMAAMGLFSYFCIFEGKDVVGQECSLCLRHNAERLGICGDHFDGLLNTTNLHPNSPEWVKAASQIAWGIYNWLTIHVVYYQHTHIRFPPALPIPGDPRNGADSRTSRSFRGNMFSNVCRLWMIVQEVLGVYNFSKAPISERVPLSFAEAKYQKLLVWVDGLDDSMARVEGCPFDVIIFHTFFHVVVTIIFRPFIALPRSRSSRLMTLTSPDSHPKAVYAASVNQLKELVFRFCAKYPQSVYTTFVNAALPTLSLAILEDLQDPLWRYYFYLCVRCWQDLYFCYPMFRDVAKAFLSMAMQKDAIAAGEAQKLLRGIDQTGEHHTTAEEAFTSFIFDPVAERVAEAQIHSMADRFEEMVVFDELIDKNTALTS